MTPVLFFANRFVKAWPEHEAGDDEVLRVPAHAVLLHRHDTDAHFVAHDADVVQRLANDSPLGNAGVRMVLAVFDVDAPGHAATDPWWIEEKEKLAALASAHPGAFTYRTRGGYRIVYRLPEPLPIASAQHAAEWSALYRAWIGHLATFGIAADPQCSNWNRLYRVPYATRDGVPQNLETLGDAEALGTWDPDVEIPVAPEPPAAPRVTVSRTAPAAAALAAAWPPAGQRVEARLALGGALAREGWDVARAAAFVQEVHAHLADRGDVTDGKIDTIVRDTFTKAAAGTNVMGWPALKRYVDGATVDAARGLLAPHARDYAAFKEALAGDAAPSGDALADALAAEEKHFSSRIKKGADWAKPYTRPPYLLEGLIPKDTVTTFFAEGGSVKSWTALALAISVATGLPFLDRYPVFRGRVLYLDYEDGWDEFRRRKEILTRRVDLDLGNLEYLYAGPHIHDKDFWIWLGRQGYSLIILDTLAGGTPVEVEENDSGFATGLKLAGRVVEAVGGNVLFVHHANKSGGMRGSSAVRDQSDVVFRFASVSEGDSSKRMRMECNKPGPQRCPAPVNIELSDRGLTTFEDEVHEAGRAATSDRAVKEAILLAIRNYDIRGYRGLQDKTSIPERRIRETLPLLIENGDVIVVGKTSSKRFFTGDPVEQRTRILEALRAGAAAPDRAALVALAGVTREAIDEAVHDGAVAWSAPERDGGVLHEVDR